MSEPDPYAAIARHLPMDVAVGGAFITMIEPNAGYEVEYNRWYEDDHYYAGAMIAPWFFAGRRWVATRDLREMRFPADSTIAQPVTLGCYITIYLTLAGHHQDALNWGQVSMTESLLPLGRGFANRQSIYTVSALFDFAVIREDEPHLQAFHVLNHPFAGMVLEVYEYGEGRRNDVLQGLQSAFTSEQAGSPVAASLAFSAHKYDNPNLPPGIDPNPPGAGTTVSILHFLQDDPRTCWSKFRAHETLGREVGGRLVFAAPFVPTIPGTDRYVSELR